MKPKFSPAPLLAEYIGSAILMIAAIAPIVLFVSVFESDISVALFANAVAVAFVLSALIEMLGPISGAHFNPMVSVIMALEKRITARRAALYIPVQIAGGITGTVLIHLMFYEVSGGLLFISDIKRNNYVFASEIICAFILVFAFLVLARVKSNKTSIIIGLLVGGLIISTSSFMFANPQVTIARIFTNSAAGIRPADAFVFIIMQFIGAFLAYGVFKLFFKNLRN